MRLKFLLVPLSCLLLFACKEKQNSSSTEEKAAPIAPVKVEDSSETYFSINAYLDDQWNMKREQPYTIMKVSMQQGKSDTALIPFDSLLWLTMTQPFHASDISDKKYLGWFRLSAYDDGSSEMKHFNYQAVSPDTFTQKLDLTINPVSNDIMAVYIETNSTKEDKIVTQRLQYRPDDIIQIVTYEKDKGKPGITTRIDYKIKY